MWIAVQDPDKVMIMTRQLRPERGWRTAASSEASHLDTWLSLLLLRRPLVLMVQGREPFRGVFKPAYQGGSQLYRAIHDVG